MNRIIEPIQIALWGLIEFVLSGMFIVKMWKFQWTTVERQGIFVLVLVGLCDVATVFANLIIGDRASTVVKACVYCLRIRLEVGVLESMANFLKSKHGGVFVSSNPEHSRISGFSSVFSLGRKARLAASNNEPSALDRTTESRRGDHDRPLESQSTFLDDTFRRDRKSMGNDLQEMSSIPE